MNKAPFMKIARATTLFFLPQTYQHLTPEQAHYLRNTPVAQRNLERRLFMALAHTFLSPEQLQSIKGLELEDPQTDITSGPPTETPISTPIPRRKSQPKKDPSQ
jgi:hypothetical protein